MLFSDVQSVERLRSPVDFGKTKRMSILIKSEISQIVPQRKNLKVGFKLESTYFNFDESWKKNIETNLNLQLKLPPITDNDIGLV